MSSEPKGTEIGILGREGDERASTLHEQLTGQLPEGLGFRVEYWPHLHQHVLEMTRVLASSLHTLKFNHRQAIEKAEKDYRAFLEGEWMPLYNQTCSALEDDMAKENSEPAKLVLKQVLEFARVLRERSPLEQDYALKGVPEPDLHHLNESIPVVDIFLTQFPGVELPGDLSITLHNETTAWLRQLPEVAEIVLRVFNSQSDILQQYRIGGR